MIYLLSEANLQFKMFMASVYEATPEPEKEKFDPLTDELIGMAMRYLFLLDTQEVKQQQCNQEKHI